jgi:hypothetical protein
MKKHLFIAAGLAALLGIAAVPSQPAQASLAENAQGNPHFTGTERSLQRSQRAQRHFSHRGYRRGWAPGFSAYGYAPGYHRYGYAPGYRPYGYGYYGGY